MKTINKNRIRPTFPPGQRPLWGGASPSHFLTFSLSHLLTRKGFTLLETLITLAIISIMVTVTAIALYGDRCKNIKCLPVKCAMAQMKAIQDAIVKGVYPDTGLLLGNLVSATTYLCLGCSEEDKERIDKATDTIKLAELSPECRALIFLLTGEDPTQESIEKSKLDEAKITWNKYYSEGWRGPYIEPNAKFNATELDPLSYPPDEDGNDIYLPTIATSWANKCEKMARGAKKNWDDDLAKEYRKAKYYQIFAAGVQEAEKRDTLCIVSRGPDCCPRALADWERNQEKCREDLVECRKECNKTCKSCMDDFKQCQKRLEECCRKWAACRENAEKCYHNCYDSCEGDCQQNLEECCLAMGCWFFEKCMSGEKFECYEGNPCNWGWCEGPSYVVCVRQCEQGCYDKCSQYANCFSYRDCCLSTECDQKKEECENNKDKCVVKCEDDFDECCAGYQTGEAAAEFSRLKITDPNNPDYIDIGDDIVMFVFSGDIRSPLEK